MRLRAPDPTAGDPLTSGAPAGGVSSPTDAAAGGGAGVADAAAGEGAGVAHVAPADPGGRPASGGGGAVAQEERPGRLRRWLPVLFALAGVALLLAATVLVLDREPAVTAQPVGELPARTAPRVPVESGDLRPGAPPKLRTGGTVPVRLDLPARAASAPVVPVGTGPDGALVVPDPPQTVGWWAPGALAGSGTGTVVVAGHVDSRVAGIGILAVLPELAVGEPVVLTGDDGRAVRYRVVARREFGKAALPADTFARTGPPRLVLVTCGGGFDPGTRSYEDNIVVHAEPV